MTCSDQAENLSFPRLPRAAGSSPYQRHQGESLGATNLGEVSVCIIHSSPSAVKVIAHSSLAKDTITAIWI